MTQCLRSRVTRYFPLRGFGPGFDFGLSGTWVSAEPANARISLLVSDLGLRRAFAAISAILSDIFSFLATAHLFHGRRRDTPGSDDSASLSAARCSSHSYFATKDCGLLPPNRPLYRPLSRVRGSDGDAVALGAGDGEGAVDSSRTHARRLESQTSAAVMRLIDIIIH
jgi:hypothetical protein